MMTSVIARVSGLYSHAEITAATAADAAQELWNADLSVQEAEEDEASGWGYNEAPRNRLIRARKAYFEITGQAAPERLSAKWLVSHK